MPLQFDDNFPTNLAQALEFAKPFLNQEDYDTFVNYSETDISEESKEELIKILHDLWSQRKTMDIPDVFPSNSNQNSPQQNLQNNNMANSNQFQNQGQFPNQQPMQMQGNQPHPQSYPQPDAFGKGFVPAPQMNGMMQGQNPQMNQGMPRPMQQNIPNPGFGVPQNHQNHQMMQGQNQGQLQGQNHQMNQGMQNIPNPQFNQPMNQPMTPNYTINPSAVIPPAVMESPTVQAANNPNATSNRIPKPPEPAKPSFDPSQFTFDDYEDDDLDLDDESMNIESEKLTADKVSTKSSSYKPSPILDSNGEEEENEFTKLEKSISEKKSTESIKETIDENEVVKPSFEFDDTEETPPVAEEGSIAAESPTQSRATVIDFSSIRNNVRKQELIEITNKFVESNQSNEKTFKELIEKQTKILTEFEDINDYVEAMTETILSLNDQMKTRAQDIQDLRNQTDIKGPSAQSQLDDLGYTLDQIKKDLRGIRVESDRGMKELLSRVAVLEANSYKGDSDIDARVSVLQSKISQLTHTNSPKQYRETTTNTSSKSEKLAQLKNIK
jgi:hypothetical protein